MPAALTVAVAATCDWLLARQHPDGYWCGELEGDTILESEYILLLGLAGAGATRRSPRRRAAYIVEKQLPDGGWAMYPGGKLEISGSVKAYFALKLTGHDPRAEYMQRARARDPGAGGADAVNSFTRFYLALLGQISYDQCPAVPPELVLLPNWSPVNIYRDERLVADDRRAAVDHVGLSAGTRTLPPELGIRELFLHEPDRLAAARAARA